MPEKLLLVIPPCFLSRETDFEIGFPVHLALLGREAIRAGWACEYLDMPLEEKEGYDSFADLEDHLRDPCIRVVGISNHTVRTSVTTRAVAERIKVARPDVAVVAGGVNATFMYRELLECCPAIDWILRGYAQKGLRALLASPDIRIPLKASGLVSRYDTAPQPLLPTDPEDFLTPPLDGLEPDRYLRWTSTYPLLTQTGCGFSCAFCTSVMPGPYQHAEVYRSVADIVAEAERAIRLGFQRLFMTANIFTSNREYTLQLCHALSEARVGHRAKWACMTRVEFVDPELLSLMQSAGCTDVAFGVEVAGADQWRSLRKGKYSEQVIHRAFSLARKSGLATTAFLMVGAPEQTEEDVERTLALIRRLDPVHRVINFFQPFPGTPYWREPERFGLSEIAPLEAWNFYESPVCRTQHFDRQQLLRIATRLQLERGSSVRPADDSLLSTEVLNNHSTCSTVGPVQDALASANGQTPIDEILDRVGRVHGARGRLLAVMGLSARLRNGNLRLVPAGKRVGTEYNSVICAKEGLEG